MGCLQIRRLEAFGVAGEDASEQVSAREQIGAFLQPERESRIIDVCGAKACYLDGWGGF